MNETLNPWLQPMKICGSAAAPDIIFLFIIFHRKSNFAFPFCLYIKMIILTPYVSALQQSGTWLSLAAECVCVFSVALAEHPAKSAHSKVRASANKIIFLVITVTLRKHWLNRLCILRRQIFRQVGQINRSNAVALRGFFGQADGKYGGKMCKQLSA